MKSGSVRGLWFLGAAKERVDDEVGFLSCSSSSGLKEVTEREGEVAQLEYDDSDCEAAEDAENTDEEERDEETLDVLELLADLLCTGTYRDEGEVRRRKFNLGAGMVIGDDIRWFESRQ